MEIKKEINTIPFEIVSAGEVFRINGNLNLKVRENVSQFQAVSLSSGNLISVDSDETVELVKGSFVYWSG